MTDTHRCYDDYWCKDNPGKSIFVRQPAPSVCNTHSHLHSKNAAEYIDVVYPTNQQLDYELQISEVIVIQREAQINYHLTEIEIE